MILTGSTCNEGIRISKHPQRRDSGGPRGRLAQTVETWPIGKSRVLSEVIGSGRRTEFPSNDKGDVLRYPGEGLLMVTSLWLKLVTVKQAKNSDIATRVVKRGHLFIRKSPAFVVQSRSGSTIHRSVKKCTSKVKKKPGPVFWMV